MIGATVTCAYNESINENICCQNPKILSDEKFAGCICITVTSSFASICLNKDVLEFALEGWNDMNRDNKDYGNENYRFIAYRQFIWWYHGHLGRSNRTPMPNCILKKIRENLKIFKKLLHFWISDIRIALYTSFGVCPTYSSIIFYFGPFP